MTANTLCKIYPLGEHIIDCKSYVANTLFAATFNEFYLNDLIVVIYYSHEIGWLIEKGGGKV